MRISDWSSDVCSSDLHVLEIVGAVVPGRAVHLGCAGWLQRAEEFVVVVFGAVEHQMFEQVREAVQAGRLVLAADVIPDVDRDHRRLVILVDNERQTVRQPEALIDRKSVVWGKSVSVRVDTGGRRILKTKKQYT